ncbi:sugar phosphate isomerase/epimerase family protein [Streptomyces sp. CA-253872]|uniref:sugar phosphate isomerase/epimerase family protein n=1 Tax=Streptomyces sp. CA-253872 TaxID=3240067 RepID=UPI003D90B4AE
MSTSALHQPPPAAVQLWSLHEEARTDLLGVLERVAALGYRAVETISLYGHSPATVRARLDALGLRLCSAHAPFPAGPEAARILDTYEEVGADTLVWSLEPEEFTSESALRAGLARVNEGAANARARGMRIGYHNHFAEFRNGYGGRRAYEVLLDALDPDVVCELDVYWAHTGGADPAAVAASLGTRLESLHLKDGPARGMDDRMVPFGEGVVDVDAAARANPSVRWLIVEMDRSDHPMYPLLGGALDHLVARGLARKES